MYQVGNFVEMKKPHACTIKSTGKKANRWEITRLSWLCCNRAKLPYKII